MAKESRLIALADGRIAQTIGAPAPREPIEVTAAVETRGQRVIVQRPTGFMYDVRAVSNPEIDAQGNLVVRVTTEEAYYRWLILGERPQAQEYPVRFLHLEG